jgi:hypothetical protein
LLIACWEKCQDGCRIGVCFHGCAWEYEQLVVDGSADMKDEAGWKLLTGDAFRAPAGRRAWLYT